MLKLKLKGGALYIALIISIVIGIILSVFILIGYFNHKQVISQAALNQLRWNIESGFNIAQSEFFDLGLNNSWQQNSFNEDSIRIKKLQWGAYALISVESKNRHQYLKQTGIFGIRSFKDTALMVTDDGKPVSFSGKTKFNGGCYLPQAKYKSAYVENNSFVAEGNLNDFIRKATGIPVLRPKFKTDIEQSVSVLNPITDSLVSDISKINNPFSSKTAIFQSSQVILNENNELSGNIKIISTDKVIIQSEAKLDNIFITAKKVIVKKGFVGTIHVVASDSIVIEEGCVLKYPSSLIVYNTNSDFQSYTSGVFLGEKCRIQGAIITICKNENNNAIINLNSQVEVYGLVYSTSYASLQGKIFGNVFSEKILLKTTSAFYDNHILNGEFDSKKHAASLIIPAVFERSKADKCVRWL